MPKWMDLRDAKAKVPYEDQGRRYTTPSPEGTLIGQYYYTKLSFKEAVDIYRQEIIEIESGEKSWQFLFTLGGFLNPLFSLAGLVPGETFPDVEKSLVGLSTDEIQKTWTTLTDWFGKFVIEPPEHVTELGLQGGFVPIWILRQEDGREELIQNSSGANESVSAPNIAVWVNGTVWLVYPDGTQELIDYQGDPQNRPDDFIFSPEIITLSKNQSDDFNSDMVFDPKQIEVSNDQLAYSATYPGMIIESTPGAGQDDFSLKNSTDSEKQSDDFNPDIVFAPEVIELSSGQPADPTRYPGMVIVATTESEPEDKDSQQVDDDFDDGPVDDGLPF